MPRPRFEIPAQRVPPIAGEEWDFTADDRGSIYRALTVNRWHPPYGTLERRSKDVLAFAIRFPSVLKFVDWTAVEGFVLLKPDVERGRMRDEKDASL